MGNKSWLLVVVLITSCSVLQVRQLNAQFGIEDPLNRAAVAGLSGSGSAIDYLTQVKPIVEGRCVVCHGCYDAPCQLKMEAAIGLERGASKDRIYTPRLLAAPADSLFESNYSVVEWRDKGFFPVLNERQQVAEANRSGGLIYQSLLLKQQNPGPQSGLLDSSLDLSLNREQSCPRVDEYHGFAEENPLAGMPFGLPALTAQENAVLMQWLEEGAQLPLAGETAAASQSVREWETFLNGATPKEQLASRYIYEHLFLANIYFADQPRSFYRLVRSSTPPGEELATISTRRPFDDPLVDRVYYRLTPYSGTILAKNHLAYLFDDERMDRYRELLLDPDYEVSALPSYEIELASNPFQTFEDIPVESRYKFMLDEARFTIMGFIKGPVCRGQVALDVIDDQFWVVFEEPEIETTAVYDEFLANESQNLRLPARDGSSVLSPLHWGDYADQQIEYLNAKALLFDQLERNGQRQLNLDLVWDGDDGNPNAALTVFRHFDSASVEYGFVGDTPKTTWLITYPVLERIHYLLVAGFDVYGNTGHQLETRLYMDFLRMEGEANFLELLPLDSRREIHEYWYRDAREQTREYVFGEDFASKVKTAISYATDDPKEELLNLLGQHIRLATNSDFSYKDNSSSVVAQLERLAAFEGSAVSMLPHQSYLVVSNSARGGQEVYSLVVNSAHSNVAHLFDEQERRIYAEDTLTVAKGFIGTYPNTFFAIEESQLHQFVDAVLGLQNEQDYSALKSRFGIRRTSPNFWSFSDELQQLYRRENPIEAGLLDYNRLENR